MVSTSSVLAKSMRLAQALARLAGQSDDEVAVDRQGPACARSRVKRRAISTVAPFLMFFRICWSPRFVADDHQPAAGVLHRLQRVVVGGDARRAGPREVQRLQLLAQLDGALLFVVEGVVVEEDLLQAGEVSQRLACTSLAMSSVRAQAPAMARVRLRPQAERAHGRAAARRVERNERVQQERNVVAPEVEVALVDLRHPGQLVEVLDVPRLRDCGSRRRSCGKLTPGSSSSGLPLA